MRAVVDDALALHARIYSFLQHLDGSQHDGSQHDGSLSWSQWRDEQHVGRVPALKGSTIAAGSVPAQSPSPVKGNSVSALIAQHEQQAQQGRPVEKLAPIVASAPSSPSAQHSPPSRDGSQGPSTPTRSPVKATSPVPECAVSTVQTSAAAEVLDPAGPTEHHGGYAPQQQHAPQHQDAAVRAARSASLAMHLAARNRQEHQLQVQAGGVLEQCVAYAGSSTSFG